MKIDWNQPYSQRRLLGEEVIQLRGTREDGVQVNVYVTMLSPVDVRDVLASLVTRMDSIRDVTDAEGST